MLLKKSNTKVEVSNLTDKDSYHLPIKSEKRSNCKLCYQYKLRKLSFIKCDKCDVYLCMYPGFYYYHVPNLDPNEYQEDSSSNNEN